MSVRTEAGVSGRHIGRYVLDDLVAENAGSALWRATDPALQRPVGARLVPLSDPRVPQLRAAAQRAAGVHDRRLVRVLDVVETDTWLGIITEWVTGNAWSELLDERWSAQEATIVALEVGRALESAHSAGVVHGRIRPDSVMVTDTHEVRLRGLGVENVLWGVDPAGDARAADLHGVGALLYAGLTRRWPLGSPQSVPVVGMPNAPMHNGRIQPPSAVSPDVPRVLDEITGRCLVGGTRSAGTAPFPTVSTCVSALERALGRVTDEDDVQEYAEGTDSATDKVVRRLSTVLVALFAAVGLALLVWQLWSNHTAEPGAPDGGAGGSPQVDPLRSYHSPVPEAPFAIVSARDFDPVGDGQESRGTAGDAVDRSQDSAWLTEAYSTANLGGKPGVGVLLDLGVVRPVKAIDLELVGAGSDFAILTSKRKHRTLADFREVVPTVTGAGDTISVRTPRAIDARWVLVWLTRLPYDGDSYVGGVRSVKVVG